MQKRILPLILVLFSIQFSFGQRLDYDHSSRWFFGLNAGATWSCTDVKNETNGGWGLTLGKSYNWKTGRRISFDLRGRYLHGNWYGQDIDTSSLSNYTGGPLSAYKDTFNMTVHNFYNDQHRLAFELVLHANRFAERTNWDPYIFGGIGVTWRQTWGNLSYQDSSLYDYPSMVAGGNLSSAILTAMDNSYETRLDQLNGYKWNAQWMPSLGIGIGYNVGPRFQIGLEHKTTFTGIDTWDGVVSNNRIKNDWYHYTSGYMQFRFKTREKENKQEQQTNSVNNINNFTTNCIAPTLTIRNRQLTTLSNTITFSLGSSQINQATQLTVKDQLGAIVPFSFNQNSGEITVTSALKPGLNIFTVYAQNDCGSATENVEVTYNTCQDPVLSFTNLIADSSITVQNSVISVSALIQHVNSTSIQFFVNGIASQSFAYNTTNQLFQATVTLQPGKNLIKIQGTNNCGTAYIATEVVYNNCITPQLQMLAPTSSGITVSNPAQKIQIKTSGFNNRNEFSVLLNGQATNTFTWQNNSLEIPVNLVAGNNTITINGTNPCGSESLVISMNYQNCQVPVVTLQTPNTTNTTVSKAAYTLKFKIQNQTALSLMVNNTPVSAYTLNAASGILEYPMTLVPGLNLITVSANNACGVDIETININYISCNSPTVSITSSGGTLINAGYLFTANAVNVSNAAEVKLTQNGTILPFTLSAGIIQAATVLAPGLNTFAVSVTNPCGSQTQTQSVTYNNCVVPNILLIQPAASGITVNEPTYQFQCQVPLNTIASELTFKVNGQAKPFAILNGQMSAMVTLNPGVNTLFVSIKNSCGSDNETLNITFKQCLAPSIVVSTPVQTSTTTTQNSASIEFTPVNCTTANQISITRNGLVVPFTYANGVVSLNPSLNPGLNVFVITASNDCGNDIANLSFTYDNCVPPVISVNTPIPSVSASQSMNISATIQNISNASQIALLLNGNGIPFTYSNGSLTASINLNPGVNTLSLTATNTCGTDIKSKSIEYTPCKAPTISITQPATAGASVNSAAFNFKALLNNVDQVGQVTLNLNGNAITSFQLVNGLLTAPLTLTNGTNVIQIFVNNGCGVDQANTTIILSTCTSPTVQITNLNGETVNNNSYTLNATVQEILNLQGLTLMVNGQVTPCTLSNGNVSATFNLQNGLNSIMLSGTNGCGTDTKSIQVNYVPCTIPTVSIQQPLNSTLTVSNYAFSAQVNGVSQGQISMSLNGNPIQNFSLNGTTLNATLNLQPGANTIVVMAQNNCGSDRGELQLTYQNCSNPTVSISQQVDTVSQSIYPFSANINNMPNAQGISLVLNGQTVPNFTFTNGVLSANLNLVDGTNSIVVNAINACGNANQTSSVYYNHCQAPIITVNSSLNASDGSYTYTVTIQNVYDIENVYYTFNVQNTPFTFVNGVLTSNVTLNPGSNVFYVSATNNCGSDTETSNVNFSNCIAPAVSITGSVTNGGSTVLSSMNITASITGYDANTTVIASKNGNVINGLNWTSGSINQSINLTEGLNSIQIIASNACGTDSAIYQITRCKTPTITLVNPAINNSTVNLAPYLLSFNVQNVSNANEMTLTQNGVILSGISLAGNLATLPVILQSGSNNFNLSVTTACGSVQCSFTITYTVPVQNSPNNNGNGEGNEGGKSPQNSPTNNTQPKPINNKGGGGAPVNTPTPTKEVKPTPSPAPVNPPVPAKEVKPTPSPAPVNPPVPAKEVKPAPSPAPVNPPAPAKTEPPVQPVKENKPTNVSPKEGGGGNEKKPAENKPAKGGGK